MTFLHSSLIEAGGISQEIYEQILKESVEKYLQGISVGISRKVHKKACIILNILQDRESNYPPSDRRFYVTADNLKPILFNLILIFNVNI